MLNIPKWPRYHTRAEVFSRRLSIPALWIMSCVPIGYAIAVYGAQPPVAETQPAAPAAPPFPYRFSGRVEREGLPPMVALTGGAKTYLVGAGDIVGAEYRVESIGRAEMTVTYLPLDRKQTIAFTSIAPEKAPVPPAASASPVTASPPTTTLGTQAPTCC
jgi:hypothetical protein